MAQPDRPTPAEGMSVRSMFGPQAPVRHALFDDVQALVTGGRFVALGITMYQAAGLPTGGTAGLAFLAHCATGWGFGAVFFAIDLPFYVLALRALGPRFTPTTSAAIALVPLATDQSPRVLAFGALQSVFAAAMGAS